MAHWVTLGRSFVPSGPLFPITANETLDCVISKGPPNPDAFGF